MKTKEIETPIEEAYIEAFSRCVTHTKGLLLSKERVNERTMKANIGIARDYYEKINNKSRISVFSLGDLNQLEREFDMEETKCHRI